MVKNVTAKRVFNYVTHDQTFIYTVHQCGGLHRPHGHLLACQILKKMHMWQFACSTCISGSALQYDKSFHHVPRAFTLWLESLCNLNSSDNTASVTARHDPDFHCGYIMKYMASCFNGEHAVWQSKQQRYSREQILTTQFMVPYSTMFSHSSWGDSLTRLLQLCVWFGFFWTLKFNLVKFKI